MPAARKAGSNKSHTTEFELERETKGAVRFQETPPEDTEAHVRSIYFRKELWEQLGKPEVIEMTIKAAE
jgi:hypothetical protein